MKDEIKELKIKNIIDEFWTKTWISSDIRQFKVILCLIDIIYLIINNIFICFR